MAAYGLYTHIASNKFRSMLLLAGLFVLIYVLVYAGALLAEVVIDSDRSINDYLMAASRDLVAAFPYATAAAAPALQSIGKSLHLARHPDAETEGHAKRRA